MLKQILIVGVVVGMVGSAGVAIVQASSFEDAEPLSEGETTGQVVGGSADFYQFDADTADAIDMRLTPDSDDLEIRIYDPDRQELVSDTFVAEGTTDRLTIKAPETGTHYVEVTGTGLQDTTDYTLDFDLVTPGENDEFAPNDGFTSAAPITEEFTTAEVWGGESDYYRVGLDDNDEWTVALTPESDSLEIYVYGPDREVLTSDTFVGSGSTEELSVEAEQSGTHYVEVAGTGPMTTTEYQLQSSQTGSGPSLADYANEDGIVDTDGLREAIDDWRAGGIDTDLLREVIGFWRTGQPVYGPASLAYTRP